jgi:hypothetical protein
VVAVLSLLIGNLRVMIDGMRSGGMMQKAKRRSAWIGVF